MELLHPGGELPGQRGAGLDQEQHLGRLLDPALPGVDRGHAGNDVHAGRELLPDERPGDLLRLPPVLAGGKRDRLAHPVTGAVLRRRATMPGTIARAPSISSAVVSVERLKRTELRATSAGIPIACRTWDGFVLIEAHAEPDDTQRPAASRARIAASAATPSKATFRMCGARASRRPAPRGPPRPSRPAP